MLIASGVGQIHLSGRPAPHKSLLPRADPGNDRTSPRSRHLHGSLRAESCTLDPFWVASPFARGDHSSPNPFIGRISPLSFLFSCPYRLTCGHVYGSSTVNPRPHSPSEGSAFLPLPPLSPRRSPLQCERTSTLTPTFHLRSTSWR